MKNSLQQLLARAKSTASGYTLGQKISAGIGALALIVGGGLLLRWLTAPDYTVMYSNLSGTNASAVVDELDKENVNYKLTDGGTTIMVPKSQVYATRIKLSGQGIPSTDDSGYAILDKEDLSTSTFKERTDYKRAMEGELQNTIEAMNGVQTAVVHLAIPQKEAFSDNQDATTASILVQTDGGEKLTTSQVQAIVNLVASSVEGLKANQVTVADANGNVLSVAGAEGSSMTSASSNNDQVTDFQDTMSSKVQSLLDTVVGAGNSAVTVTADLDFDSTKTTSRTYSYTNTPPLSEKDSKENYSGGANGTGSTASGVVGADGQMDNSTTGTTGATSGSGAYTKEESTKNNSVGQTDETRIAAPGNVKSLHVAVVLNQRAKGSVGVQNNISSLLSAGLGIDTARGDTINVTTLPFDTTAKAAAKKEIAEQAAEEKKAQWFSIGRNVLIAVGLVLALLLGMRRLKKREQARMEATDLVVQQLRDEKAQAEAVEPAAAMNALERSENSEDDVIRGEIAELVERQPEEVASLLRGWLVERS